MKLNVVEKIRAARHEVREINQTTKKTENHVTKLENHVTKFEKILAFERFYKIKQLLHVMQLVGKPLVRIGKMSDGGYVMIDDFTSQKVAYSFGISDDVSWDKDMASRGYDVFMYDHTIVRLPEENIKFHWKKIGISQFDNSENCNSLKFIINENGHANQEKMILKMDVEGAEWASLSTVPSDIMNKFSQIVLEMHFGDPTGQQGFEHWVDSYYHIIKMLKNINQTHQLIHVHGNNYGHVITAGGLNVPISLEVLYANKAEYEFSDIEKIYPTKIDQPNNPLCPDIFLGTWNVDEL